MLDNLRDKQLILASKSPRRQQLLAGLGLSFQIFTKDTDEDFPADLQREAIALYLARKKAEACVEILTPDTVLITCDTIVWIDNQVLNKPADRAEAIKMLELLSGQQHTVYTGVCVRNAEKEDLFYAATEVYFRSLSADEIAYYVDTCKPYDKAGSYGVQEWMGYVGIDKIEGCFFNVMGLPLNKLYESLRTF